MKSVKRTSGFTLIELLVVIAIIAILAAILFPVFGQVKERGRQVKCLGNLKQLSMAMILYCDSNEGRLPNTLAYEKFDPRENWEGTEGGTGGPVYIEQGSLYRYTRTKALYVCPSDQSMSATSPYIRDAATRKNYPLSYTMNHNLDNFNPSNSRRQKDIILLIHEGRNTINDGDFNWASYIDIPTNIHNGGTTMVYIDGHAGQQSRQKMIDAAKTGVWDPLK